MLTSCGYANERDKSYQQYIVYDKGLQDCEHKMEGKEGNYFKNINNCMFDKGFSEFPVDYLPNDYWRYYHEDGTVQ